MKGIKLGLLLVGNESWMGGVYYVMNIIRSLDKLPADALPKLVVFYSRDLPQNMLIELQQNPRISLQPIFHTNLIHRAINALSIQLFGYNWWLSKSMNMFDLDIVYPFLSIDSTIRIKAKKLYWIPDFQHHYLPDYFSEKEIAKRNQEFDLMATEAEDIVFSSHTASRDFSSFYPHSKAKKHVFQFSSEAGDVDLISEAEIKAKYDINRPYFIVCNQFWKHKNHQAVLETMTLLKADMSAFDVVFTGKEEDYRNPSYPSTLIASFQKAGLTNAKFLGFISRLDQLSLMKEALAVIQPSRFEGWGTVVEDAKALKVPVIASDTPIHREQLGDEGCFFQLDSDGLANVMKKVVSGEIVISAAQLPDAGSEFVFIRTLNNVLLACVK